MAVQGIESELDGSHLGEVVREANPANVKWYDIGLQLGLESFVLDGIKVHCGSIPADCFRDMIKEWLKGDESNWIQLQDALRSSTVREFKLAGVLQRNHYFSQSDEQTESDSEGSQKSTSNEVSSTTSNKEVGTDHLGDIIPYGCGCGDCNFSTFIENGCPKPKGDTSPFPFLNTKGLTENERQILHGRLYEEFQLITRKFSHLTSAVCESLIDRNISVKRLVRSLRDLKAFQPAKSDSPLLQDRYKELKSAEDIDDVFDVISDYVSFFSFHIIEHIVVELGGTIDQETLQKYKGQLVEYCSRNIFECPSYSTPKKGKAILVLKVDSMVEMYNMKHLQQLTARITKILSLYKYTLHLCSVEKGCVQLVYQLPFSAPGMIFPLSTEQENEFAEAGFTKLECNEWKYSFINNLKAENGQPARDLEDTLTEPTPPLPPKRASIKGANIQKPAAIDEKEVLDNYNWYHGNISRPGAEDLLQRTKRDSFLVRSKQEHGQYALSEVYDGKMKHYIVKKTNGLYELEHSSFHTIPEMVKYLMEKYHFKPCQRSGSMRTEPIQVMACDWIDPGTDVSGDSDWTGTGEEWTGTGDSGFHTGLPKLHTPAPEKTSSLQSPGRKSQFLERKLSDDMYTSLVKENMNPPQTYTRVRKKVDYLEPTYARSDTDDYKDIEKIEQRPPVIYDRVHDVN